MAIEFTFNDIDEIDIGLHMYYGEDENGSFHATTIGFLICSVSLYVYKKQQ